MDRTRAETATELDARVSLSADDAALAGRIRLGDTVAFRAIMYAYFDPAARVAFRLLHSRDAAQDVAQALFSQLWQQRTTFHPTRSIRNYLLTAARNNALMELRQRHVRDRHQDAILGAEDREEQMSAPSAAAAIDNRMTLEKLLATLSTRHRQALEFRYLEQLSYAEIGQMLEISAGAAEQLVMRALDAVRRGLSSG